MRPETIERRKKERKATKAKDREILLFRLRAKAEKEGKDSIWAEMLSELLDVREWKKS